jgi:hypothetical protein
MSAEKGFLGDLLGLGGITEHAQGHPEDPVLVRGDQLLEGPRVARAEPIEELRGIGSISFPHS